jgi:hypothetical protein
MNRKEIPERERCLVFNWKNGFVVSRIRLPAASGCVQYFARTPVFARGFRAAAGRPMRSTDRSNPARQNF